MDADPPLGTRLLRARIVLPILCCVFALVASVNIKAPAIRHNELNSVHCMIFGRGFARLGYLNTRFTIIMANSPDMSLYDDWRKYYYTNQCPLIHIITSVWFRALGEFEWVFRLSLIVAGTALLLLFYAVARRLVGEPAGLLATAVLVLNPMFLYNGIVVPYFYLLLFGMGAWYAALRIEEKWCWKILMFACIVLGCFSNWSFYHTVLALIVFFLLRKGFKQWTPYLLGLTAVLCFSGNMLLRWWADPSGEAFKQWQTIAFRYAQPEGFTVWEYIYREARDFGIYYTVGLLLPALVGLHAFFRARRWDILVLALFGLEEILLPRYAYYHDFLNYPLMPLFALAAAAGIVELCKSRWLKVAVPILLLGSIVQTVIITHNRLTKLGGAEPHYRCGLAINKNTQPNHRVLNLLGDYFPHVHWYADRWVATPNRLHRKITVIWRPLQLPDKGEIPIESMEDIISHLQQDGRYYDVVVVGAAEHAVEHIEFFRRMNIRTAEKLEREGFYTESHPLRQTLSKIATRIVRHEAFVFYWMR